MIQSMTGTRIVSSIACTTVIDDTEHDKDKDRIVYSLHHGDR